MRSFWSKWVGFWAWVDSHPRPRRPEEIVLDAMIADLREKQLRAEEDRLTAENPLHPMYAQLDD